MEPSDLLRNSLLQLAASTTVRDAVERAPVSRNVVHRFGPGARTEDELMLRPEIGALRARLNLRVVEVLSRPHPGWQGETGRITRSFLSRQLPRRPHRLEYFVCGPQPMVSAVSRDLSGLGVPLRRIHTERFGAV